jgi:hypothetical protein
MGDRTGGQEVDRRLSMGRVFKRTIRPKGKGRVRQPGERFYISYVGRSGYRIVETTFTDEAGSREILRQREAKVNEGC